MSKPYNVTALSLCPLLTLVFIRSNPLSSWVRMGDVEPRLVEEVASEHTAHSVADELLHDYVIVPHYMLFVVFFPNSVLYE